MLEQGYYGTFGKVGARTEMPGCSLCMGNNANVFLASAELAAVCSILGKIPTVEEYMAYAAQINATADDTYRYLNFNLMADYQAKLTA